MLDIDPKTCARDSEQLQFLKNGRKLSKSHSFWLEEFEESSIVLPVNEVKDYLPESSDRIWLLIHLFCGLFLIYLFPIHLLFMKAAQDELQGLNSQNQDEKIV
jgi:hypothetical protein